VPIVVLVRRSRLYAPRLRRLGNRKLISPAVTLLKSGELRCRKRLQVAPEYGRRISGLLRLRHASGRHRLGCRLRQPSIASAGTVSSPSPLTPQSRQ